MSASRSRRVMMSRRHFLRGMATVAGASVLAACVPVAPAQPGAPSNAPAAAQPAATQAAAPAPTSAPAVQNVTLQFWTRLGDNAQVTSVTNDWNKAQPAIQIALQGIPGGDYRTKLAASVAGGNPPDIVGMDVILMPQYNGQKALLPIDDLLQTAGPNFVNDFAEGLWFSNRLAGSTYGIPWWSDCSLLWYNVDLFDKAGISTGPATWDELMADAKAVTKTTGDATTDVYGAIFPVIDPSVMFTWLPFVWAAGADLLDANNCPAFNNEGGVAAMQLWVDLFQNGYMPRSAVFGQSGAELMKLFFNQRGGMYVTGPSIVNQAKTTAPDLKLSGVVMPHPANGKPSSYLGGDNLVMMKATKAAPQGWQFMQFMVDPQRMRTLALANDGVYIGGMMTRLSAQTSDFFDQFPNLRVTQEAAKVGRAPNTPFLTEARVPVYDGFQAAMAGQKTVKQALTDAEAKVKQITGCTS